MSGQVNCPRQEGQQIRSHTTTSSFVSEEKEEERANPKGQGIKKAAVRALNALEDSGVKKDFLSVPTFRGSHDTTPRPNSPGKEQQNYTAHAQHLKYLLSETVRVDCVNETPPPTPPGSPPPTPPPTRPASPPSMQQQGSSKKVHKAPQQISSFNSVPRTAADRNLRPRPNPLPPSPRPPPRPSPNPPPPSPTLPPAKHLSDILLNCRCIEKIVASTTPSTYHQGMNKQASDRGTRDTGRDIDGKDESLKAVCSNLTTSE